MGLKQRLAGQLKQARGITDGMLASFQKPADWTHQIYPGANHALWFAGHMGCSDNFFLSIVAPDQSKVPAGFDERFGTGSKPTGNPGDYPPLDAVLGFMRERRQALEAALESLSEEQLLAKTPPGTPEFLPDIATVFETVALHEALHVGQVSMVRRALGQPPLMG